MSQQPVGFSGPRVSLFNICEWKNICGIKEGRERAGITRRFGEAMIEAAATTARYVRINGIKHLAVALVGIESLVEKMAQESPRLRNAEPIRSTNRGYGVRLILEIRYEVANGSQP